MVGSSGVTVLHPTAPFRHLAGGDVDGALCLGVSASAAFAARGSALGLGRVAGLRGRLADAGHTDAARALDERLRGQG
jgi:hypothetical protein